MTGESARLVIRAPNHLGDVVAALPAMAALHGDVVVVRWLLPLVQMAGLPGRLLPLDRGVRGWAVAVRRLRAAKYARGVLFSPAFSAAWLFRWGGVAELRGTDSDARGWLLAERVPRAPLRGQHRAEQYRAIAGLDAVEEPTPPRLRVEPASLSQWREQAGQGDGPLVGVFPGSHAPARRWPRERFRDVVARLTRGGARVAVLGAEHEAALTAFVAAGTAGAIDLGGRTTLVDLAAVLSLCDVLVTNDSGPMHLAAALGTPTVTVWGPSDPQEARPLGAHSTGVVGRPLPCQPCHKNQCPRSGPGTVLDEAHEECMRLIDTNAVLEALEGRLRPRGTE